MCTGIRKEFLLPASRLYPQSDPVSLLTVFDIPELDSLVTADLFFQYHLVQKILEDLSIFYDEIRSRVKVPFPCFAWLLVRIMEQLLQQKPYLCKLRS